jgi:FkbM family methyltransferase
MSNLKQFATHTLDESLLPEAPVILDAGCRWFDFTRDIFAVRPKAFIGCLDPARDVEHPGDSEEWARKRHMRFWNYALVGQPPSRWVRFAHFSTGEGDFVTNLQSYHDAEMYIVETATIQDIANAMEVERFDAVKLDCEGSEFDILQHWPGPIATQISVEFHDWDKPQYRAESYYDQLFGKLPWYKVVQHELSKQGEGVGHWDSLLVLAK